MTIGIDKPELMAQEAKERVERDGFRILKVKAGINPADDIRALTLIREAVGPDIRLRVDANQGYTVNDAVRVLNEFEKIGVDAVEQCLPWWDMDGSKILRQKLICRLCWMNLFILRSMQQEPARWMQQIF